MGFLFQIEIPIIMIFESFFRFVRKFSSSRSVAGICMVVATVAILALAVHSDDTVTSDLLEDNQLVPSASRMALKQSKLAANISAGLASQFFNVSGAQGFVPNTDKIHFPDTWESFTTTFGAHLTWALIVLFFAALTWAYVRFVRPQSWFKDMLRTATESATLPINVGDALGKVPSDIDENDIVSTLVLVPGEAVFFTQEASGRNIGTVYKLSVTNLRIIAQKAETTLFGTCQVLADPSSIPSSLCQL